MQIDGSHPDTYLIQINDVLPTSWCFSSKCSNPVTSQQPSEASAHVAFTTQAPGAGCRASPLRGELRATQLDTGSHHRAGSLIQVGSGCISTARNDSSSLARSVNCSNPPHPYSAARAPT